MGSEKVTIVTNARTYAEHLANYLAKDLKQEVFDWENNEEGNIRVYVDYNGAYQHLVENKNSLPDILIIDSELSILNDSVIANSEDVSVGGKVLLRYCL